ncbi:GUN4 domain protein [Rubidibacter lacunae KORDI 51-2]|uniref:GUN4 domain protein n=1 Tax=Rubidibacter lacunae KORDI 51-2 TaxID=582515 RepID=U5DMU8_9CHRO|nr:GUN4 domain-containing protein [Rubidibacter lacunae]ERN42996.1 GUN4 domain protein [Rubidibacter lacunae KORDI 51-2]
MSQHDLASAAGTDSDTELSGLRCLLFDAAIKDQLTAIDRLAALGDRGIALLQEFCLHDNGPGGGKAHQVLCAVASPAIRAFLSEKLPQGVVPPITQGAIDYQPVIDALVARDYQYADRLTLQALCQLVGPDTSKRQWLYFTEVENLPVADLRTLDRLWIAYSEGKFGFSVQQQLWLSVGQNFEKLWPRIGWKQENVWTRYPDEFVWDTSAPRGHLPLSNQLRGVRPFAALMAHPAWE